MTVEFTPRGVCSRAMKVTVEDGIVRDVEVVGGCNGNLKGISTLVKGMPAKEAIEKLQGTTCGSKATSCPDQLSKALAEALAKEN